MVLLFKLVLVRIQLLGSTAIRASKHNTIVDQRDKFKNAGAINDEWQQKSSFMEDTALTFMHRGQLEV